MPFSQSDVAAAWGDDPAPQATPQAAPQPAFNQADIAKAWNTPVINAQAQAEPEPQKSPFQPVPFENPQDLGQFAQNAGVDVGNTLQGLVALGSLGVARTYEALPMDLFTGKAFQPNYQSNKDPWTGTTGLGGQPLIRPEDAGPIVGLGAQMVNDYKNKYIDPLKRGDLGAIGKEFLQRPLSTAGDLMPFGGAFKGSGALAKQTAARVASSPLGQAAAKAPGVSQAANFAEHLASKATPWIAPIQQASQQYSKLIKTISKWDDTFKDELRRGYMWVKEAYDKVPEEHRPHLISAGEMRDLEMREVLSKVPEVAEFWRRADKLNDDMAKKLIEAKAMTPQEAAIAKFGPMTGLTPEQLLSATPEVQNAVRLRIQDAQQKVPGQRPVYFGQITNKQIRDSLKTFGSMFVGNRANIHPSAPKPGGLPGWLRMRKKLRDDTHSSHAMDVWATRYLQAMQFLHLRDFFMDVLKGPLQIEDKMKRLGNAPVDAGVVPKGHSTINPRGFFQKLGQSQGISPEDIENFCEHYSLPDTAIVPTRVANKLKSLERGLYKRDWDNWAWRGLEKIRSIQVNAMLGFSMGWALWQQPQNATIYGMAAFRGLHDIPASIMAFPLALDKEVRAAMPARFMTDLSDAAPETRLLEGMAKAYAPLQWVSNHVFKVASAGDNFWRSSYAIYEMLKQTKKLSPKGQSLMADAFDLQANKTSILEVIKNNPQAIEEAAHEVNKWFGRYDQLFNQEQRIMRTIAPFWNWWCHAWSITKALPETPYKTALLSRLTQCVPLQAQDTSVLTEPELRSGGIVVNGTGPNGKPLVITGNSLAAPMVQTLELANTLMHAGNPHNKETAGLPLLNAAVGIFMNLTGRDSSLRDFNDPSLIPTSGIVFGPDGQRLENVKPDVGHIVMRNLAPTEESQLREIRAYPDKPSVATSIFDFNNAKQRRDFTTQEPIKNFNAAQLFVMELMKLKPHEQTLTAEDEERIKWSEVKKFRKAFARQQGKLTPVPTLIDELLKGKVEVTEEDNDAE